LNLDIPDKCLPIEDRLVLVGGVFDEWVGDDVVGHSVVLDWVPLLSQPVIPSISRLKQF
jgi:hypothetical protein